MVLHGIQADERQIPDKQELRYNREQQGTRAKSYRCGGWEVSNYRGGLETYDGIPPWQNGDSWIQKMAPYLSTEEVLLTNEFASLWHIGCGIGCDVGWG